MTTFRASVVAVVLSIVALGGVAFTWYDNHDTGRDACARMADVSKAFDGVSSTDGKPFIVGLLASDKTNLLIDCLTE